jgi:hypothetical protein
MRGKWWGMAGAFLRGRPYTLCFHLSDKDLRWDVVYLPRESPDPSHHFPLMSRSRQTTRKFPQPAKLDSVATDSSPALTAGLSPLVSLLAFTYLNATPE